MANWPGRRYCGNSIASIVRIGIKRQTAGTTNMKPKFALTTLLAFAAFAPAENAAAQNALGGRPGGYYYYDRGCYVQRPTVRGSWSRRAIADSAIYRETRDVPDRHQYRASRSHRAAISASILVT